MQSCIRGAARWLFAAPILLGASAASFAQVFDSGTSDSMLFDRVRSFPGASPDLPENFAAAPGETLQVNNDDDFFLELPTDSFDASSITSGTELNLNSGTLSLGQEFNVLSGSELNVNGGRLGFLTISLESGSQVNIRGGEVNGGLFSAFAALSGSELNLFGTEFFLNGELLDDLVPGVPLTITTRDDADAGLSFTLSGSLANDDAQFFFDLSTIPSSLTGIDSFAPDATLTVTLVAELFGDFDSSGVVDIADYQRFVLTFSSATALAADGNSDGVVNAADYAIWRDSFGAMVRSPVQASTVPEPTAFLVLGMASVSCMAIRRRSFNSA